jgi:hypothetical protein
MFGGRERRNQLDLVYSIRGNGFVLFVDKKTPFFAEWRPYKNPVSVIISTRLKRLLENILQCSAYYRILSVANYYREPLKEQH